MVPINLSDKVALVTGVGDNDSFAWYIAKALQAAGAKLVLACHPRGRRSALSSVWNSAQSRLGQRGDGP